jgi:hypothetical protein
LDMTNSRGPRFSGSKMETSDPEKPASRNPVKATSAASLVEYTPNTDLFFAIQSPSKSSFFARNGALAFQF